VTFPTKISVKYEPVPVSAMVMAKRAPGTAAVTGLA